MPYTVIKSSRLVCGGALGTRSRLYYKYEGVSPAGSHKPNTAVAQAFYNAKAGRRRIATVHIQPLAFWSHRCANLGAT